MSYQSDMHFGNHLNNVIPIKTIASDSILEEVDIVYFDSLYKYKENKDKFEILDSVSVYTPLVVYVPQNLTTRISGIKVDFSDIIDFIESEEITNNVLIERKSIQMDKLEERSIFAFYTLLFNYYSNGKTPEELSANELEEIVQKLRAFVKDNQGKSEPSVIFSKYKGIKDGYVYFHFNETTLVEEVLVAVSENGAKYLKEMQEIFSQISLICQILASFVLLNMSTY